MPDHQDNTTSTKTQSYQPYASKVVGEGYSGYVANARDNKAKDQRVQVTIAGSKVRPDEQQNTENR